MDNLKITWRQTISIWWSFAWRCCLVSMVTGLMLGKICEPLMNLAGRPDLTGTVRSVSGHLFSIPISIIFLKQILNKKYKNFSVSLLPNKD